MITSLLLLLLLTPGGHLLLNPLITLNKMMSQIHGDLSLPIIGEGRAKIKRMIEVEVEILKEDLEMIEERVIKEVLEADKVMTSEGVEVISETTEKNELIMVLAMTMASAETKIIVVVAIAIIIKTVRMVTMVPGTEVQEIGMAISMPTKDLEIMIIMVEVIEMEVVEEEIGRITIEAKEVVKKDMVTV